MAESDLPTYRKSVYVVFDIVALGFALEGVPTLIKGEWIKGGIEIGIAVVLIFTGIFVAGKIDRLYKSIKDAQSLAAAVVEIEALKKRLTEANSAPSPVLSNKDNLLSSWRRMATDVQKNHRDDPAEALARHSDYPSLRPYLRDKTKREIEEPKYADDEVSPIGTIDPIIQHVLDDIDRLARTWGFLGEVEKSQSELVIHSAHYGTSPEDEANVTDKLQRKYRDGLVVDINNNELGCDPAPNKPKRLRLEYSYGNTNRVSLTRPEGTRLLLPEDWWLHKQLKEAQEQHSVRLSERSQMAKDYLRETEKLKGQINDLERGLADAIANTNKFTKINVEPLCTIGFGYLPRSPLEMGWKKAYMPDSGATYATDPDIPGSLRITVTSKSEMAIDHQIPPHAILSDHLTFTAKYTDRTMIFVGVKVAPKDGTPPKNVWLKFYNGKRRAQSTPGYVVQNPEWQLQEQTIWLPAKVLDGKMTFEIDLGEVVALALGEQGWVYESIFAIRLRGNLSVSPIILARRSG